MRHRKMPFCGTAGTTSQVVCHRTPSRGGDLFNGMVWQVNLFHNSISMRLVKKSILGVSPSAPLILDWAVYRRNYGTYTSGGQGSHSSVCNQGRTIIIEHVHTYLYHPESVCMYRYIRSSHFQDLPSVIQFLGYIASSLTLPPRIKSNSRQFIRAATCKSN